MGRDNLQNMGRRNCMEVHGHYCNLVCSSLAHHFIEFFFANRSCGGWTNGGQIAGEIHNPRKSFNVAILIVMGLTLTFSILPLAIAYCANPTVKAWQEFCMYLTISSCVSLFAFRFSYFCLCTAFRFSVRFSFRVSFRFNFLLFTL